MKSSRHSKIAGNFGESLILYWLSKHGFECAGIDHTGIDIIARHPSSHELMGISVKSRTRVDGTEDEAITIPGADFTKVDAACEAFGCLPYFAIVVDAKDIIRVFIVPKLHFLRLAPIKKNAYWRMNQSALADYSAHDKVMAFELKTKTTRWWQF